MNASDSLSKLPNAGGAAERPTPADKVPAWMRAAVRLAVSLAIPFAAVVLSVYVYATASAFGVPQPVAIGTGALAGFAVAAHFVLTALARSHTERLVNVVALGVWMAFSLWLTVAGIQLFNSGAGGDAANAQNAANIVRRVMSAGLAGDEAAALALINAARGSLAMVLPLAIGTLTVGVLPRVAVAMSGDVKPAAATLLVLVMFIGGTVASFMHIYEYGMRLTGDMMASVFGAVIVDAAFLAAEVNLLLIAKNRGVSFRDGDVRTWLIVGIAAWVLIALANVNAVATHGTADGGAVIIGLLPAFGAAAGGFASVMQAITRSQRDTKAHSADDDAAKQRQQLEDYKAEQRAEKQRQHELELARIKAEARRPIALPRVPAGVELNQGDDTRAEVGRADTKSAAA